MTAKIYRDETGMKLMRPPGTRWESGLHAWCRAVPQSCRGTLVEVGTWTGEAAMIFAEYFDSVICVDSWVNFAPQKERFLARTATQPKITHIHAPGNKAAALFADGSLDGVYIDANHQWRGICADSQVWKPKVKDGGIAGGHDIDLESVRKAVDLYFPGYETFEDESWLWRNAR